MSYQDRIYRQSGICAQKNSTVNVARTSSDLKIYEIPMYTMTTADKIVQNTLYFDLSGISYNDIFTATTNCFTTNLLSGSCFNSISWYTNIYANDELVTSDEFFISTGFTGDIPVTTDFSGSVVNSLTKLGYNYNFTGTSFSLTHPTNHISIDIATKINILDQCPLTGSSIGNIFTGSCEYDETIFDLDFSGLTVSSDNVYTISTETGVTMDFIFTANTNQFYNETNTRFKFEVYKYNTNLKGFTDYSVFKSRLIDWTALSATSATTYSIPVDNLLIDGDYLIKGYYEFNNPNEFALLRNVIIDTSEVKTGTKYGIYDEYNDFHFIAIQKPTKPIIKRGKATNLAINALTVNSFELTKGQTIVTLPSSNGDYIISLNGLILAIEYDYILTGVTSNDVDVTAIQLNDEAKDGDIMTIAFSNSSGGNNLKVDIYDIQSSIVSGTTDNQGSNKIYYNTTTNKYELYTTLTPLSSNDVAVTLNGALLANNIDYYQSSSNEKRIILEGQLLVGDIINVYYNTETEVQGDITITNPIVEWSISNIPNSTNGTFTLELATDEAFTNIVNSVDTKHIEGVSDYSNAITLVGGYGTNLYYRIKNEKKYTSFTNDVILITEYSDIIPITVKTNTTNNY